MSQRRKALLLGLRLLVAGGLLALLARSLELARLEALLRSVAFSPLLLACAVILLVRLLGARRWQLLLRAQGISISFLELARILFVSMFMGYFIPGAIGADVVRGYQLARSHGRTGDVVVSLLLDRVLGMYGMTLVALLGALSAERAEARTASSCRWRCSRLASSGPGAFWCGACAGPALRVAPRGSGAARCGGCRAPWTHEGSRAYS